MCSLNKLLNAYNNNDINAFKQLVTSLGDEDKNIYFTFFAYMLEKNRKDNYDRDIIKVLQENGMHMLWSIDDEQSDYLFSLLKTFNGMENKNV